MGELMTPEQADALRAPFPKSMIGQLPKAGIMLDYVGHAGVTDRLLAVDPLWTWEPIALTDEGTPMILVDGQNLILWIRLTVCGVTRLGVGIVGTKGFELQKQLISDAIRNAAMRFGVALDLWSKEDLHASSESAAEGAGSSEGLAPPARHDERDQGSPTPPAPGLALATKPQRAKIDHLVDQTGAIPTPWPLPDDFTKAAASALIDDLLKLPVEPPAERVPTLRKDSDRAADEFVG